MKSRKTRSREVRA